MTKSTNLTSDPKPTLWDRIDQAADDIFIWPAVFILLLFSIFPLIVSLYLSFERINFVRGGVEVEWVGWLNYRVLNRIGFWASLTHFRQQGGFCLGLWRWDTLFPDYLFAKS